MVHLLPVMRYDCLYNHTLIKQRVDTRKSEQYLNVAPGRACRTTLWRRFAYTGGVFMIRPYRPGRKTSAEAHKASYNGIRANTRILHIFIHHEKTNSQQRKIDIKRERRERQREKSTWKYRKRQRKRGTEITHVYVIQYHLYKNTAYLYKITYKQKYIIPCKQQRRVFVV